MAEINLQIAQAVRHDSIPMRTIAYITLVLLPGAFIASIFGMNFFQFDPTTRTLTVASTFWQYWAITIPITLTILSVWNFWVYQEKKQGTAIAQSIAQGKESKPVAEQVRVPSDLLQTLQGLTRRVGRVEDGEEV